MDSVNDTKLEKIIEEMGFETKRLLESPEAFNEHELKFLKNCEAIYDAYKVDKQHEINSPKV